MEVVEELEIEELQDNQESKMTSDEEIWKEMVEHDIFVKMPPIKQYKIEVYIRSIKKGEPRVDNDIECEVDI